MVGAPLNLFSLECNEYYYGSFTLADSVFGSVFYMTTGLHALHVIVGVLRLFICYSLFALIGGLVPMMFLLLAYCQSSFELLNDNVEVNFILSINIRATVRHDLSRCRFICHRCFTPLAGVVGWVLSPPFKQVRNTRMKFEILYYVIGILYLIFDLEIIFLFPLATVLFSLGSF